MKRIVIVGGGDGGTMVANRLARELKGEIKKKEVEVVLIAEEVNHVYQPGSLFVSLNRFPPDNFYRPQKDVVVSGVQLMLTRATLIDVKTNTVKVESGETVAYDYLVIATGAHPTMDTVPGLKEGGHEFYTMQGALKLRDKLATMDHGRIVLAVDVPHKCPVAVIEFTLMLDEDLRNRGIRDNFEIVYTYPIGRPHSLVPVSNWLVPEFEKKGIQTEVYFNLDSVDPIKKTMESLEGSTYEYDLLVMIPAHRGAKVIFDSGLGDETGFIPTERDTLRMKDSNNVYVIGDATNLPISKAGSTAHYQTDVIVSNVRDSILGNPANHTYDGKVFCFIEGGLESATYIAFSYTKPPQPNEPSELLHWFKLMYNEIYWIALRGIL